MQMQTPEGSAETPSEKLYLMTAILIWEGLVDLPSLWPHVSSLGRLVHCREMLISR